MKKIKYERYLPLGILPSEELKWITGGFIFSTLFSLWFFIKFTSELNDLYYNYGGEKTLWEGVMMPDFAHIVDGCFAFFAILAMAMVILAAYHFLYHYQGSKSIYTMRRLPKRSELWIRCLTVPVTVMVLCALASFILLVLYYAFYMLVVPDECLLPNQWQKIWNPDIRELYW